MSKVLLVNNNNTVVISPVRREDDGELETTVVFSVTLYDSLGSPLSGLSALSTAYRSNKQDNAVVLPGADLNIPTGTGYELVASATGSFATKIKFEEVPVVATYRAG